MARRFEFVGKQRAKLSKSHPDKRKIGDADRDGMKLYFRVEAHSSVLDQFSTAWEPFLYKAPSAPAKQDVLPGTVPKKELTPEAVALGKFPLGYEQTGCTLILYRGVTKMPLKDSKVDKVFCTPKEAELVIIEFEVFAPDLDEDTMGAICHLTKRDSDIELTLPEALQKDIGNTVDELTPIGSLAASVKGNKGAGQPALQ